MAASLAGKGSCRAAEIPARNRLNRSPAGDTFGRRVFVGRASDLFGSAMKRQGSVSQPPLLLGNTRHWG